MKLKLILGSLLFSSLAMANPFDSFTGEYEVSGQPSITNENAAFCNRFDFSNLTGLEVTSDTEGYNQTHVVRFVKANGWSGHPIMEYRDQIEMAPGTVNYAKTTGSATLASNEWGTQSPDRIEKLIVTLSKSGSSYKVEMKEVLLAKERSACSYSADLKIK